MDTERWREISDLAAVAAETSPAAREALLLAHPELRQEVESLLRYLEEESGPLDQPVNMPALSGYAGLRIGPYRVEQELGRGGMGVVLLARREGVDFEQVVAIKLARVSFQSGFFLQRFLEERQILSRLDHPNIARFLDGGVAADGSPYIVMQYVDGVPLPQWCDEQKLNRQRRVEVLLKICEAVAYAHEHLVVHRDLKPANILVNSSGEPMLLDFGTARLLQPEEPSNPAQTTMPVLTARYASPEQVNGFSGSTRTDVYSLGVVLYELLTGQWPYAADSGNVAALLRAVCEAELIAPSRHDKALAGDLDAILLKALSREGAQRYDSVRDFAADLRRHLEGEPVLARRPTWRYRAGRFVRRHRLAVAAATMVVLSLAGATIYSLDQAQRAERERMKAVQVAMFLENLLGASRKGGVSPLASGGRELKVVDVIETAAARVGEEFKSSPDIEVGLRSTIGSALLALGERAKAQPHVERAVKLSERIYGDDHAVTSRALTARGRLRLAAGDYAGAQADLERTLRWHETRQHEDLPFQHSLLAESYFRRADLAGARRHFEAALVAMRRQFGDQHLTTATMINNLAVVSDDAGDAESAEKHFAEAATVMRSLPGPPGNLVYPLSGLQRAAFFRGDYAQAKQICEEAYAHARKTGGERHPNTLTAALQLAVVKAYLNEPEAERLARQALALQREVFPASHMEISRGLAALARVVIRSGKGDAALPLLEEAMAISRKVYPKANWRNAELQMLRGVAMAQGGKSVAASEAFRVSLQEFEASLPPHHPRVREARQISEAVLKGLKAP